MKSNQNQAIRKVAGVGIFSSLAFVTTLICKIIPSVGGFLSLDAKDAVIAIASFIYGPVVAPIISAIAALIEFATVSDTGWYGLIMNFASSAVFSLTASLVYKFKKSFNGATVGFGAAIVATTGIMLLMNVFVTPLYFGMPTEAVIELLPTLLLPFNFAKTLLNSAIALMLYKPVVGAMRAARLVPRSEHKTTFSRRSVLTLTVGGVSLFVALVILLIIW